MQIAKVKSFSVTSLKRKYQYYAWQSAKLKILFPGAGANKTNLKGWECQIK